MSGKLNICKPYLRWRHSKGYGVHSPYAYLFVTDVLNPGPYAYYAYWEIDGNLRESEIKNYRLIKRVKFYIRLSHFLKSRRIVAAGEKRAALLAAAALNMATATFEKKGDFEFKHGDLLIIENAEIDKSVIEQAIKKGVPMMTFNPSMSLRNEIGKTRERGLLFSGRKMQILIPREEMAFTTYDIKDI